MADEQVVGMNYFDHQFLRREDFSTAQQYHVDRLRQHNQLLHQAGIVDGLEVTRTSPRSIQVTPGRAVDQAHREVVLRPTAAPEVPLLLRIQTIEGIQETEMHLTGAALSIPLDQVPPSSEPGNPVFLTIRQGLKETTASADPGITGNTRLVERAIIEASTAPLSGAQLLLAQINRNLDGTIAGDPHLTGRQQATARLADDAITSAKIAAADGTTEQDTNTGTGIKTEHLQDQAVTSNKIAANTIQLDHLEESLRQSIGLGPRWVRLPFLPKQIGNLPPFNLGLTHSNSAGAARGIMEIPVPAGATQITQLRIAGTENADKITIRLWRAKIDSGDRLLENTFAGAPFNHLFPNINAPLDSELEGLALEVETTARADIWFVAAEFK
jgi:hypothetical protein